LFSEVRPDLRLSLSLRPEVCGTESHKTKTNPKSDFRDILLEWSIFVDSRATVSLLDIDGDGVPEDVVPTAAAAAVATAAVGVETVNPMSVTPMHLLQPSKVRHLNETRERRRG
jgi:hypothetical protein